MPREEKKAKKDKKKDNENEKKENEKDKKDNKNYKDKYPKSRLKSEKKAKSSNQKLRKKKSDKKLGDKEKNKDKKQTTDYKDKGGDHDPADKTKASAIDWTVQHVKETTKTGGLESEGQPVPRTFDDNKDKPTTKLSNTKLGGLKRIQAKDGPVVKPDERKKLKKDKNKRKKSLIKKKGKTTKDKKESKVAKSKLAELMKMSLDDPHTSSTQLSDLIERLNDAAGKILDEKKTKAATKLPEKFFKDPPVEQPPASTPVAKPEINRKEEKSRRRKERKERKKAKKEAKESKLLQKLVQLAREELTDPTQQDSEPKKSSKREKKVSKRDKSKRSEKSRSEKSRSKSKSKGSKKKKKGGHKKRKSDTPTLESRTPTPSESVTTGQSSIQSSIVLAPKSEKDTQIVRVIKDVAAAQKIESERETSKMISKILAAAAHGGLPSPEKSAKITQEKRLLNKVENEISKLESMKQEREVNDRFAKLVAKQKVQRQFLPTSSYIAPHIIKRQPDHEITLGRTRQRATAYSQISRELTVQNRFTQRSNEWNDNFDRLQTAMSLGYNLTPAQESHIISVLFVDFELTNRNCMQLLSKIEDLRLISPFDAGTCYANLWVIWSTREINAVTAIKFSDIIKPYVKAGMSPFAFKRYR